MSEMFDGQQKYLNSLISNTNLKTDSDGCLKFQKQQYQCNHTIDVLNSKAFKRTNNQAS